MACPFFNDARINEEEEDEEEGPAFFMPLLLLLLERSTTGPLSTSKVERTFSERISKTAILPSSLPVIIHCCLRAHVMEEMGLVWRAEKKRDLPRVAQSRMSKSPDLQPQAKSVPTELNEACVIVRDLSLISRYSSMDSGRPCSLAGSVVGWKGKRREGGENDVCVWNGKTPERNVGCHMWEWMNTYV
jgi:hypothetical protein